MVFIQDMTRKTITGHLNGEKVKALDVSLVKMFRSPLIRLTCSKCGCVEGCTVGLDSLHKMLGNTDLVGRTEKDLQSMFGTAN